MGIIKQGILGGVSGKVGAVVGTSWKGRAVLKSLPLSVANPNTVEQAAQRKSFKSIAQMGSLVLTTTIQKLYNPISGNITGYNRFCQQNKAAFDSLGAFVPANFKLGGGQLILAASVDSATQSTNDALSIVFTNPAGMAPARSNDTCHFVAVCEETGDIFASDGSESRDNETTTLKLMTPGSDLTGALHFNVYQGYVSADGRSVSVASAATRLSATFS